MTNPVLSLRERAARELASFIRLEASGGILLVIAAALALLCANSPLADLYRDLFALPVQVRVGALDIDKPLLLWINDGLMAVFEIHIETTPVAAMKPYSRCRPLRPPNARTMPSASRRCAPLRSSARDSMKPPPSSRISSWP